MRKKRESFLPSLLSSFFPFFFSFNPLSLLPFEKRRAEFILYFP